MSDTILILFVDCLDMHCSGGIRDGIVKTVDIAESFSSISTPSVSSHLETDESIVKKEVTFGMHIYNLQSNIHSIPIGHNISTECFMFNIHSSPLYFPFPFLFFTAFFVVI